jgi:TrmH family RNA methyltransferase
MAEPISSSSNPLIKQIRALRQRKKRDETGLFLVEGIHHVGEAVEAGWDMEVLVYAPDQLKSDFASAIIQEQYHHGVRCVALTRDLFDSITDKENPQGILAIVHQQRQRLEQMNLDQFHLGAAIVSPQDPGNVGTILRTLDGVGAGGLFLLEGGVDPYHPTSVRASMGAIFWKNLIQTSFYVFLEWVRQHEFRLIGSSANAGTDYRQYKQVNIPTILLLGSEQKGLSQDQLNACDSTISLPMKGRASSLNLAVAAGVLLYTMMGK